MTTLEFRLNEIGGNDEPLLTTCELAVYVDDVAIWPAQGTEDAALEIQIDDLLSHLTVYWKPLALRQTYPFTLNPPRPSLLRAEAQRNWDAIAGRLAESKDERWNDLIRAWYARNAGDGLSLLRWSTSLDRKAAEMFAADGLLRPPATMAEAANDNDELRLAARMASALPTEQVRSVLERVSMFPKHEAPQLDELATAVRAHFEAELAEARPYEQGEAVAGLVRRYFDLAPHAEVDVFGIVAQSSAQIYLEDLEPPTLDALAVWGDRHGPAVLLNQESMRHRGTGDMRRRGQMRVTLAHEFCHLLIDAEHALSAVDVLHSRMPITIEQRARAFAAEFLLPSRAAGDLWLAAGQPRGRETLGTILGRLCRRFMITKSVAAWKLEHGARLYDVDLAPILDSIVPQR